MDFSFTKEQNEFSDSLSSFLAKECSKEKLREAWQSPSGTIEGLWEKCADFGLTSLMAPLEKGGLAMKDIDTILLSQMMGRAALPLPVAESCFVATSLLSKVYKDFDDWSSLVSGKGACGVLFENYPYVLYGDFLKWLIIQNKDELYMVRAGSYQLEKQPSVDGSRRLYCVKWDKKDGVLLASGDAGKKALREAFDRAALAASGQLLGAASTLNEMAIAYAKTRKQFGVLIGTFQTLKHKMADAHLALEFAKPLAYRAAYELGEESKTSSEAVSMAKAAANKAAHLAASTALTVHGAMGYSYECDLHLFMKRVWCLEQAYGNQAFHYNRVGQCLEI